MRRIILVAAALAVFACAARTPARSVPSAAPVPEVDADEYTRYELLAPETSRFHILYEVSAIESGATFYFNPIRKGSVASDERVIDRMTGETLRFEVVSAEEAKRTGLRDVEAGTEYIRVHLPRPVAGGGQVRLLIEKTYRDAKSYYATGETIVFERSVGIRRDAVLLPAGFELVSCNVPSQVLTENGKLLVSFFHDGAGPAPLRFEARRLP